MKRSKLRNDFLKDRSDVAQSAYRKQRNLCVTLLRKAKKYYFSNLEPKLITDKTFWKSVKLLFSDKITVKEMINLTENEEIISSDTDIPDMFNDYFGNVVHNLNIPREKSMLNIDLCINPVLAIVEKYKHHQSIISINKK